MAKFKGCPRCGKKMPLEIKGQCEQCKKDKYKYLKNLPGIKREKVQQVYNNTQWNRVRFEAIKRAEGLCEVCRAKGKTKAGEEVHHIVKVANGSNASHYDLGNLVYVCRKCHRAIEGMSPEEIIKFIG